jgi:hypothetical protein
LTQRSDFLAAERMDVINPALRSADMQSATVEVNLIPAQAADFRSAQPVPVRIRIMVVSRWP